MQWRRALAWGVISAGVGCVQLPVNPASEAPSVRTAKKDTAEPKRAPQPSTCVALGVVSEKRAENIGISIADRDRLYDQARRAYQQALQTDPKNHDAQVCLARLYTKMGDHPRAIAAYQKAVQSYPNEAPLWNDLGMIQARQKSWTPALESLSQAVKLEPENKAFNHAYGYCLARAGHPDQSVAVFAKLGDEASANYNVARMLHHMQLDELSRQYLEKALEKDAKHEEARQLLAELSQPAANRGSEEAAEPGSKQVSQ